MTNGLLFTAHCGDVRAVLYQASVGQQDSVMDSGKLVKTFQTVDHNADNEKEVQRIEKISTDPIPIRANTAGGMSVAGSLHPTRAIGDAYLKNSLHSFPPFDRHCPYIDCVPDVHMQSIPIPASAETNCSYLVLATDGIWDYSSCDDICSWLSTYQSKNSNNACYRTEAEVIMESVLENMRRKVSRSRRALTVLPKGVARRKVHDDMTVLVIRLDELLLDSEPT